MQDGHSNQRGVNVLLAIIVLVELKIRLASSVLLVTTALVELKTKERALLPLDTSVRGIFIECRCINVHILTKHNMCIF